MGSDDRFIDPYIYGAAMASIFAGILLLLNIPRPDIILFAVAMLCIFLISMSFIAEGFY